MKSDYIKDDVRKELKLLAEPKYKDFNEKIVKNEHPMIGVRVPKLRKIAKRIAKNEPLKFLTKNRLFYYEEILLQGFVIGYMKICDDEKYRYGYEYFKLVKDWSECDLVVATFKFLANDVKKTYDTAIGLCSLKKPFMRRSGIVMLMDYCLTSDYFEKSLSVFLNLKSDDYYVNMAIAWAISECFVKDFDYTFTKFRDCDLDKFTYNKTIQKCAESFRIDDIKKSMLNDLKK